jgi:thioredoxin
VDKNQELAARYNVSSIPVFLILNGGQIVANHLGVTSEATLRTELEQFRGS